MLVVTAARLGTLFTNVRTYTWHCQAMTKSYDRWTVLPHGPLTEVDDGILTVVGVIRMPLMKLPRRMTVVRLSDGRLVIWSAIALNEQGMTRLESFGRPAFLIVPNSKHRLDLKAWKARFPQAQVVAPRGARDKVAEIMPVDACEPSFGDPEVQFLPVAGTDEREGALLVRRGKATTLVVNDLIGNIRDARGFGGWLLRVMKFAGTSPQVPSPVKAVMLKDAAAFRAQLLQWSQIDGLRRILVSHGEPIEPNAAQALKDLAASLQ